jgi:hypothetical protein
MTDKNSKGMQGTLIDISIRAITCAMQTRIQWVTCRDSKFERARLQFCANDHAEACHYTIGFADYDSLNRRR